MTGVSRNILRAGTIRELARTLGRSRPPQTDEVTTMQNIRPFGKRTPQLGARCHVDPSAVVIGDVTLGDDCSVWPQAVIRGDMHRITIGARSSIQDGSVLHITHDSQYNPGGWPLVIGREVTVGHRCVLHGCTLGDQVLIGNGAIVMDGAVIEDQVVVAANALVAPGKTLRSGYLYVGSPAREKRALSEQEIAFFAYTANNYVRLKDQYLTSEE